MKFEGKMAIDIFLFILAAAFSFVAIVYVAMLWSLRRNFFIVLRSPRLACPLGLLSTTHFLSLMYVLTINSTDESTRGAEVATLISFPALLTAEIALIMTAVRLLVVYYPAERARWGRYTKEIRLTYGLVCVYFMMEIALWSAAGSQGMTSVNAVVAKVFQPLSAVVTIAAAVVLGPRLRKVDDEGNMSDDIRLVGGVLLGITCLQTTLAIARMPFLVEKYLNIAVLSASHPPVVWICIIRPVRNVVRSIPERRRSTVELLLVSPGSRVSSKILPATVNFDIKQSRKKGGACDSNRLASIMSFLPLREAFGEFCRRSLCSESFQFLLDVFEFKNDIVLDAATMGGEKGFKGFGGYLAIVNDYIKAGSHSEVNIEFRTKSEITKYAKFKDYAALDLMGRKEVFSAATEEVEKMLVDNLLNKFLVSAQYKGVVDFEAVNPE